MQYHKPLYSEKVIKLYRKVIKCEVLMLKLQAWGMFKDGVCAKDER